WKAIATVMQKRKLLAFFDCAYLGFGRGLEKDAHAMRLFAERGCEMLVAFSAAKNFSLYAERVGALFIVTENAKTAEHVKSRVKQMIRSNYSNPPKHGAAIVAHILNDASLKVLWLQELDHMRERIHRLRQELMRRFMTTSKRAHFQHVSSGHG